MHVSPRPIRLPHGDPSPRHGSLPSILAFTLCALLAMAGTILLSECDGGLALTCADSPVACGAP